MLASGLIDTSAILALINKRDSWHSACSAVLPDLRLPLITSAAVLAELFYFVEERGHNPAEAWRFVRSGAISVASITDVDLPPLNALMVRYHDRPMDFADATLVHLAERESLRLVFTIDHGDFETYRVGKSGRFIVVPERQ